jgi:hypothetical protein
MRHGDDDPMNRFETAERLTAHPRSNCGYARHCPLWLAAVLVLVAAGSAMAGEPLFTIEDLRVEGLRFASPRIIVAESNIVFGRAYSEVELRDSLARIQRLPFVVHADFALRRGSERNRYVLVVTVEETKPLVVDYGSLFEAIGGWPRGLFHENSGVYRHNEEYPDFGVRLFPGSRSMLLLTADAHGDDDFIVRPVFGISWTQYDLFGTRASASISARYREESLSLNGLGLVVGREGLRFRDHLLFDASVAVPLSGNQALRAEWYRANAVVVTGPDEANRLGETHYDRPALLWIYNSQNDLLFPTRGAYGEIRAETQSGVRPVYAPGTRNTIEERYWNQDLAVQVAKFYPLTAVQSIVVSGDALATSRGSQLVRVRGGYTATRLLTVHGAGTTTLHFEAMAERVMPYSETNLSTGLAIRTSWGVAHIDFHYLNWRGHSP